jgi:hypothetical protein
MINCVVVDFVLVEPMKPLTRSAMGRNACLSASVRGCVIAQQLQWRSCMHHAWGQRKLFEPTSPVRLVSSAASS